MPNPVQNAFPYPSALRARVHGPEGYLEYSSYKQWLRDEFEFRCIYCLTREMWFPNRDSSFSVDHFLPKSGSGADLKTAYPNLFYCCSTCNLNKGIKLGLNDPDQSPIGRHLIVNDDGSVLGATVAGRNLIDELSLNHPERIAVREKAMRHLRIWDYLLSAESASTPQGVRDDQMAEIDEHFKYPPDLPDLGSARPPANSKPEGVELSHYARRGRGELPRHY